RQWMQLFELMKIMEKLFRQTLSQLMKQKMMVRE
uniref:Uncharacterized protein n=1 Tax=Aegilops tauschii subsp. strangulata TaxID=200361 RepID=A0A453LU98_AEGTS